LQMRVPARQNSRKCPRTTTDVDNRFDLRPSESFRQSHEVAGLDAGHGRQEARERMLVSVEGLKDRLASVLDLVLRLPRLQCLRQMIPKAKEPAVEHLRHAASIGRLVLVQKEICLRRAFVDSVLSRALSLKKRKRHE